MHGAPSLQCLTLTAASVCCLSTTPLHKPQCFAERTELAALALQLLFVVAAMAATFLLVPRGFSAGEIDIQSDHMSWNTTKGTYQLNLLARIPISNPNFLNVSQSSVCWLPLLSL